METVFKCPNCNSLLNIGEKIVLSAETKKSERGIYMFNSELGNYDAKKSGVTEVTDGDIIDFFCPLCFENLESDVHKNLANIVMIDDDKKKFKILFSKIVGEKATYKFGKNHLECFGKNQDTYKHLLTGKKAND